MSKRGWGLLLIMFLMITSYALTRRKNVSVAVIWHDDEFLIVQNMRGPFRGFWGLPGGKAEFMETSQATASREIFEEVGLQIHKNNFNYMTTYLVHHTKEPEYNINVFEYRFDDRPVITLNAAEHLDYEWIRLDELDDFTLIPDNAEHIREIYIQ
jgi:8-oxo-dGTP pyrophosphatase MutT (NUDIX family)